VLLLLDRKDAQDPFDHDRRKHDTQTRLKTPPHLNAVPFFGNGIAIE
jgi:hypothetical protein